MSTWSMCHTVLAILAEKYPEGLTKEELFEKANAIDPSRFGDYIGSVDMVLGTRDSAQNTEIGLVRCWKEKDGKIFYDTSRKVYVPSLEMLGFSGLFNDWLKKNGLRQLVLCEKLTPLNSEKCPIGFDWESIPGPGQCNWDYETKECKPESGCHLSGARLKVATIKAEGRDYGTYYKRVLDGD